MKSQLRVRKRHINKKADAIIQNLPHNALPLLYEKELLMINAKANINKYL